MPWLRRLVAGPSSWRPEFNPSSVHVIFVMDKVAMRQVFLRVLHCSPLYTISSFLQLHYMLLLLEGKTGKSWNGYKKICFQEVGEHWTGEYFQFLYSLSLLTPWSRVLLEKLTVSAASREIPRIFGTRRFITVLTSARHLSLS